MRPGRTKSFYTYKGMLRARLLAAAGTAASVAVLVAAWLFWQQATLLGHVVAVLFAMTAAGCLTLALVGLLASGLLFEYGVRQRFRAICREKGLAKRVMNDKGRHRWRYPSLTRLEGNEVSWRAVVKTLFGQSLADWDRSSPAFVLGYGASLVQFRHGGAGRLRMMVGYHKVEAHEFEHRDLPVPAPAGGWREQLLQVEVGRGEDGRSFCLPLLYSHLLIAGITGAGKGSVIWSLLMRLKHAITAGVVRCWGFDPKMMELAMGRGFFGDRYADTVETMVALLDRAHDEMLARAASLAGQTRKFEPSREHPLEVLVIDELGYLVALIPDRKERERVEKLLSALLVLGRAVGFTVIGALQDPRKETLSMRDLFPTRVAMRLPKGMVDLVLGPGMYEQGAQCDLIPVGEADGAGVAFVVDEASMSPVLVRMSWCSDDAIRQAAAQLSSPSAPRLTVVASN